MFTGIISSIGYIESAEESGDLTLRIACHYPAETLKIGESIAINGACLTVVTNGTRQPANKKDYTSYFTATLSAETLACTASRWHQGEKVNLERALRLGDTLDGHMVTGHVDGIATLEEITTSGASYVMALVAPEKLSRFIAKKGSVTLDGISLTVNKVENNRFWVNIIPHTWEATTLSERRRGDKINLEIDIMARYVARLAQSHG